MRSVQRGVMLAVVALTLGGAVHGARGSTGSATRRATAPTEAAAAAPRPAAPRIAKAAVATPPAPDEMTLKGGAEGTVFKSLTVEGEDRVRIDFDRPELTLDLDPSHAPGLEWGSAKDVLDRTLPDLTTPLVAGSVKEASPYLGRPWLTQFASGPVARFSPAVKGVERWTLTVADAHGQTVRTFTGHGEPPRTIDWDGRAQNGNPVTPGLTYSYVFEAYDRAGNRRHFVGRGFSVSAYRCAGVDGPTLLFSARALSDAGAEGAEGHEAAAPAIVLEAASWINQSERTSVPIHIRASARSYEQAQTLAQSVTSMLTPLVLGDPARLQAVTSVETDAPEEGTIAIGPGR